MHFLKELGIFPQNGGVSTGTKWIESKGTVIESFSPVNGQLIAAVSTTDKDAYETLIITSESI